MNKLGLNKVSTKRKGERIMDRLNKSLNIEKYIQNLQKEFFKKNKFLKSTNTSKVKAIKL